MKLSEKKQLEQVYDLIYKDEPLSAVDLMKKMMVKNEVSADFQEILQFKIGDILFQHNQFEESKIHFLKFLKKFPESKFKKNVEIRLKYIENGDI